MSTSIFLATSLDGYIARADGRIDWLPATDDIEPHGFEEFFASADALVIGRGTYDTVIGFGGWGYGKKPVVVLTAKPELVRPPKEAVCEVMSGEPASIVAHCAERGWEQLYVDGGVTITRFLEAGLIDRMIITRIPILIGSGIPLFGPLTRDIRWKHVRTQVYKGGLVQSEYVRDDQPARIG